MSKQTPEGRVKDKIKSKLQAFGIYYFMPVQNGMGKPALDFFCCHQGTFIGIEAKAPGKQATERQLNTMREIKNAGGYTFVVDGDRSLEDMVGALALLVGT